MSDCLMCSFSFCEAPFPFISARARLTAVSLFSASVLSATVAGLIIGTYFMAAPALANWGGVLGWAGLHAVGGIIGGLIGAVSVIGLVTRGFSRTELKR